MSRQFEDASNMWRGGEPFAQWRSEIESMAVDLVEHDDEFVVTVDLPGFERDEVDIPVTNHTLRIDAEREESVDETERTTSGANAATSPHSGPSDSPTMSTRTTSRP
jgi:HSP20 family protein